jgi:hypothetical protein
VARIALTVLACSSPLSLAASPPKASASAPGVPQPAAFVEAVRSGSLDAQNFDFDHAGFFRMPRTE